jgi:hypothetical protein
MSIQINHPATLAEFEEAFWKYERALMANQPETLDGLFWNSHLTLRYGVAENLYGYEEISHYRHRRASEGGAPSRSITKMIITTYGTEFGTANIEYVRTNGRVGRQSQTWVRMPEGWRIVAAHVSLILGKD